MSRITTILPLIGATLLAATLAACESPVHKNRLHTVGDPPTFFRGTLAYEDDAAVPVGSTITVRLLDVSERSSTLIASDAYETRACKACTHKDHCPQCASGEPCEHCAGMTCRCDTLNSPPFPFLVRYDATETPPHGRYAVEAAITAPNGRVLYASDQHEVISPMTRFRYDGLPLRKR